MEYKITKTMTKRSGVRTQRTCSHTVDAATREQLHDWYLSTGWQYAYVEDEYGHSHGYFNLNIPGQIARTTYTYIIPA